MAPVQHVTRFRRLSREELTQALDEVLSRASTTPTTCSPHRPLSAGPTRPRKAQTNKAASSTPPKVERKGELAPPQPTMRYTPPAQPYWAADGFRYLAEWLHKLSPSAFKVASYVAYQQLRGIVFVFCSRASGIGKTANRLPASGMFRSLTECSFKAGVSGRCDDRPPPLSG
jgi:hypothetical protein